MDLGSAVLSAELALDLLEDADVRERVVLSPAPLVEGLVVAAVSAAGGSDRHQVAAEAAAGLQAKAAHLEPPSPAQIAAGVAAEVAADIPADGGRAGSAGAAVEAVMAVVPVANPHGLHARPAARIVAAVRDLDAEVWIRNLTTGSAPAPATSLSRLGALGAVRGHELELRATGPQAAEAVRALGRLAADHFGDRGEAAPAGAPRAGAAGIAVGPVRHLQRATRPDPGPAAAPRDGPVDPGRGMGPGATRPRARSGADRAGPRRPGREPRRSGERPGRRARAAGRRGAAHRRTSPDRGRIGRGAGSVGRVRRDRATLVGAAGRLPARTRGRHPGPGRQRGGRADRRGIAHDHRAGNPGGDRDRPGAGRRAGSRGGAGHRARRQQPDRPRRDRRPGPRHPAGRRRRRRCPGHPRRHGGRDRRGTGAVQVEPSAARLAELDRRQEAASLARARELAAATGPAIGRDGVRVLVAANVGSLDEARAARAAGADGAGLVRTELLFLDRPSAPSVAEQAAAYAAIAAALTPGRVVVRSLDAGGDKPLDYLALRPEANPFLGLRGLRLGLQRPELLRDQLRAIGRVALDHPVDVMFPMVSTVGELTAARRILAGPADEPGPPPGMRVGMMVEVPAAALKIASFLEHLDFVSIGTNDLAQYTLAAERGGATLAGLDDPLDDPLDPAVLRLVDLVCRAAAGRIPVAVCGEAAADDLGIPVLLGLGVRELSVAPTAVPRVKAAVRELDIARCARLAARVLTLASAAEVRAEVAADVSAASRAAGWTAG